MKLFSVLAVGLMLAGPVLAQDFDKGLVAYWAGDYATALQEWRPLAEQGSAQAQRNLGFMYSNGEGVLQDYAEAVKLYRLAAEQGNTVAQLGLGDMYDLGRGVLQDDVLAHMWFNIVGANGDPRGSENRGIIEKRMTREQIAEAQALARRCMASNYQDCG
jgi:TPR repeat protein